MRIVSIGWLVLTIAARLSGQDQEIAVGLNKVEAVPLAVLTQAQVMATRIYAGIGVTLEWCNRLQDLDSV